MPLKAIKQVLDEDPQRAQALVELEDRILERARTDEGARMSRTEAARRYEIPREALSRLEELGVLSPNSRGYAQLDQQILEAISHFRAGGYEEAIGFTVYDTLRYKKAVATLAEEEVKLISERLAGEDPDHVIALLEAGVEPLRDLIGALHSKELVAELVRQREARSG